MAIGKVSVIIPTLNEEKILPDLFINLEELYPKPMEIIFVDGPSKDETACMIQKKGYKLIRSVGKGRALQMNEGAYQSHGEILVFLHADTLVPKNLVELVSNTLIDQSITLGGFTSIMSGKSTRTFLSFQNRIKTYLGAFFYNPVRCVCYGFRLLFGDQVMFCRKEDFIKIGGYDYELPIMEDADLCLRMNKLGRIKQINSKVYSSDRRVASMGLLKAYICYLKIFVYWRLGACSNWLKSQYGEIR